MTELTVIIASYNSRDFLSECIRRVEAERERVSLQIVVVDNASTDQDVTQLAGIFPLVQFVRNETNLGFSKACNIGFRTRPARFYLLLNPDCMVLPGAISGCLELLRRETRVGIAGCRVENPDGSLQLACRRSIPVPSVALFRLLGLSHLFPRSPLFGRYNFTYLNDRISHEVEAVSGSFLMIRSEVLDQIGGFDEEFFLYGEDLDLCYRTLKAGWKVFYFAEGRVTHFKRQSSRQVADLANYHFYHSMKLFYRKHFRSGRLPLGSALIEGAVEAAYRMSEIRRRFRGKHQVGSER